MKNKKIKKIIRIFKQADIMKMELEFKHFKIKLEKFPPASICISSGEKLFDESLVTNEIKNEGTWVLSPLVGTYYDALNRTASPFVSLGDEVKVNDVLCVIEAMKIMNELRSDISGRVVEIAVANQSMVQYNQPLIRILEHD
jgi:acetyl-CoA carboxylase biotin carboxyl carrier protein